MTKRFFIDKRLDSLPYPIFSIEVLLKDKKVYHLYTLVKNPSYAIPLGYTETKTEYESDWFINQEIQRKRIEDITAQWNVEQEVKEVIKGSLKT